ncbi:hypothetical protein D9M68_664040 [compost metagenome]
MQQAKIYLSISKAVADYAHRLTRFNANFNVSPPIGGWSYSEVYSHIFDSSLLSLMAIQNCIKGEAKMVNSAWGAKAVLFFGMLPPGKKYKVPERLAKRVKKIQIQEAQQLILNFEQQLAAVLHDISSSNPKIRVAHPRLGPLNAIEWLRFTEVHLYHHLKQLSRIEKSLVK